MPVDQQAMPVDQQAMPVDQQANLIDQQARPIGYYAEPIDQQAKLTNLRAKPIGLPESLAAFVESPMHPRVKLPAQRPHRMKCIGDLAHGPDDRTWGSSDERVRKGAATGRSTVSDSECDMGNEFKGLARHSAEHFGDTRDHWWNLDFLQLMATRWKLDAVRDVLDVGCGVGHWGMLLASVMPEQVRVTGIDREPSWVEHASARALARGLEGRFSYRRGEAWSSCASS
jgi:Methyltransferase domain